MTTADNIVIRLELDNNIIENASSVTLLNYKREIRLLKSADELDKRGQQRVSCHS